MAFYAIKITREIEITMLVEADDLETAKTYAQEERYENIKARSDTQTKNEVKETSPVTWESA